MINENHREEKKIIEIQKAYEKFVKNEYREIAHDIRNQQIVDIASTEGVYDSGEKYEYMIQASLDLENRRDIYIMENTFLIFKFVQPMTYDSMIYNLTHGQFDDWISIENGIDCDLATRITDDFIAGKSICYSFGIYPSFTIEEKN